jgi:hypothetical protein
MNRKLACCNEPNYIECCLNPIEVHGEVMCGSCNGTGLEEGYEWFGEKCHECRGRRFLPCDCYECMPEQPQPGAEKP